MSDDSTKEACRTSLHSSRHSTYYYAPPLISRDTKRWCCLACVWRPWRTSGLSREQRKTKIGTEVVHVTRDSDTTFKVKTSNVKVTRPLYSPPNWRVRQLQRWAWERVGRWKLLLRCRLLGGARRFSAHGGGEGWGISWRPPAYSLLLSLLLLWFLMLLL